MLWCVSRHSREVRLKGLMKPSKFKIQKRLESDSSRIQALALHQAAQSSSAIKLSVANSRKAFVLLYNRMRSSLLTTCHPLHNFSWKEILCIALPHNTKKILHLWKCFTILPSRRLSDIMYKELLS
jgi:hypothetical protein